MVMRWNVISHNGKRKRPTLGLSEAPLATYYIRPPSEKFAVWSARQGNRVLIRNVQYPMISEGLAWLEASDNTPVS